jgi:hypothetical protein
VAAPLAVNLTTPASHFDTWSVAPANHLPLEEGDVLVVSVPNQAKGVPPSYYVFLVQENALTDLTSDSEKFSSADWTFKITRNGNELLFDLGFDDKKKKLQSIAMACFT